MTTPIFAGKYIASFLQDNPLMNVKKQLRIEGGLRPFYPPKFAREMHRSVAFLSFRKTISKHYFD